MAHRTATRILIVDDDESICRTLSAILQTEGYLTTIATTGHEAIEKAKTQFFDLTLLDIRLTDTEGTKLLAQLQEISPETIKIMVTGYPSLKNVVEALNKGADSYIVKPINPPELLKTIKDKLETHWQTEKITKEKLANWVQSQARKIQSSQFPEFLEDSASDLSEFGLTKTEAKIYITMIALGMASVSEIAHLSKVRREEVYRMLPELEKRGIITRMLKTPRKFSAIEPETAIQILTNAKLDNIKQEINKLEQKQTELISKLKRIELPIKREKGSSVEVINQEYYGFVKLTEMLKHAKKHVDIVAPLQTVKIVYMNRSRELVDRILKSVKMRIITEKSTLDEFFKKILEIAASNDNSIELRHMDNLPFNLMLTDDEEAMWGEKESPSNDKAAFWTDDPTQINILKTTFESLWQKSIGIEKE